MLQLSDKDYKDLRIISEMIDDNGNFLPQSRQLEWDTITKLKKDGLVETYDSVPYLNNKSVRLMLEYLENIISESKGS